LGGNVTIEDLGNLGELIAAIATVATLAYLAIQIRQGAKATEGSTAQSLMHPEVSTFALIAQHASIYDRGRKSIDKLNSEELIVFEQLVSAVISLMVSGFSQYQLGLMSSYDEYLSDWKNNYLEQPGFQSVWTEIRHSYPVEFGECLDALGKPALD
jgi:hypothetical protein